MKDKKIKNLWLLLFFAIFFFLTNSPVFAMEVNLHLGSNDLPHYVSFLFSWLIAIAAGLSVIAFAVGAIGLIISVGNAEAASNSKGRMKSAVLGLILTLSSFLILNTINTNFTSPALAPLATNPQPTLPTAPGVYYFTGGGCTGSNASAHVVSQDQIEDPFKGHVGSVLIINDATHTFGVILHQMAGLTNGGNCDYPIFTSGCSTPGVSAYAANIFNINPAPLSSGDGVDFFSEPFGQNGGSRGGYYKVAGASIPYPKKTLDPKNDMIFVYTGINQPAEYTAKYKTFQDRPGSINIKGSYLVALYSASINPGALYCQTFTGANIIPDLNAQPITRPGGPPLDRYVYIIPTR